MPWITANGIAYKDMISQSLVVFGTDFARRDETYERIGKYLGTSSFSHRTNIRQDHEISMITTPFSACPGP